MCKKSSLIEDLIENMLLKFLEARYIGAHLAQNFGSLSHNTFTEYGALNFTLMLTIHLIVDFKFAVGPMERNIGQIQSRTLKISIVFPQK